MVRRFAVPVLVGVLGLVVAPRPAAAARERVVAANHERCMWHCRERGHLFRDAPRSTARPADVATGRRNLAQTLTQTKSTFCQRATPDPTKDPATLTLADKILSWLYAVFCVPDLLSTATSTTTSTTSPPTTTTSLPTTSTTLPSSTTTSSTSSTTSTTSKPSTTTASPWPFSKNGTWSTSWWRDRHRHHDEGWDRPQHRHHEDDDRWEHHKKKRHHEDDDRRERRKKRHRDGDDWWERRKKRDRDHRR